MTQDPFSPGSLQVLVPDLGTGQHSIQLKNWLVSTGDEIIAGERIAELLVDSVLFYLESEHNGIFRYVVTPVGTEVNVGQTIAEIQVDQDLS